MVVVPGHKVHQFSGAPLHGRVGEFISAGQFTPHQQSQTVGPVVIAGVLDFLVLSRAVEAHGFGQFNIPAKGVAVRRRQQGFLPVALIQHHPQIQVVPVEEEPAFVRPEFPHSEISQYLIAALCTEGHVDEIGVVR